MAELTKVQGEGLAGIVAFAQPTQSSTVTQESVQQHRLFQVLLQ